MLDALLTLTHTGEFEDSGGVRFHAFEQGEDAIRLMLLVDPGDDSPNQRWRVDCSGVQRFELHGGWIETLETATDHPVLWDFTEPVVALHFYGPARDALAVVGALYERHRSLAGDWIPFHRYLNPFAAGTSALLESTSGQLASGPACLIVGYTEALAAHQVGSSTLAPRPAKVWNGQQWVAPPALRALLLDRSFIVAEKFSVSRTEV
jgi:hypothetical protein